MTAHRVINTRAPGAAGPEAHSAVHGACPLLLPVPHWRRQSEGLLLSCKCYVVFWSRLALPILCRERS